MKLIRRGFVSNCIFVLCVAPCMVLLRRSLYNSEELAAPLSANHGLQLLPDRHVASIDLELRDDDVIHMAHDDVISKNITFRSPQAGDSNVVQDVLPVSKKNTFPPGQPGDDENLHGPLSPAKLGDDPSQKTPKTITQRQPVPAARDKHRSRVPKDCQELGYSKTALPLTALASFPGAGNTWARHIMQQTTGIYTGSLYKDGSLRHFAFPAEGSVDSRVIAIKTHEHPGKGKPLVEFDRAVVLLRDPYATLRAEYNRRRAGHLGYVVDRRFNLTDWTKYVNDMSTAWLTFYERWLHFPGPLHILRYEDLVSDLPAALQRLCQFLETPQPDSALTACVLGNSDGGFHRKKKADDLLAFSNKMTFIIDIFNRTLEADIKRLTGIS